MKYKQKFEFNIVKISIVNKIVRSKLTILYKLGRGLNGNELLNQVYMVLFGRGFSQYLTLRWANM